MQSGFNADHQHINLPLLQGHEHGKVGRCACLCSVCCMLFLLGVCTCVCACACARVCVFSVMCACVRVWVVFINHFESTRRCIFRKVEWIGGNFLFIIFSLILAGPFWEIDSQTGAPLRRQDGSVIYPAHKWQAGGDHHGGADTFDVWAAIELLPSNAHV